MFDFLKKFFGKEKSDIKKPSQINAEINNSPPSQSISNNFEKSFKQPSKKQLEEVERLGLSINKNMSSREVWQLVQDATKDPRIKALQDAYIAEQNAIFEADDREEYGDTVVDEKNKWEKFCQVGVHHIVVFKKGKTIDADIIEFEQTSIEGKNKYYVKIDGLRPKVCKPRNGSPYIEWEKEISFRPNQIYEVMTLPKPIEMFEINDYESAKEQANKLKEKHI